MDNSERMQIENNIKLYKFKYSIADRYIHLGFNAYLRNNAIFFAFLVALIQVLNQGTPIRSNLLLYLDILLIFAIISLAYHYQYLKSMAPTFNNAVKFEDMISAEYTKLNQVLSRNST